ncbi:MAG: hypothetical protein KAR35_02390 [Candidatus Heimdallarchaeota archaeon]|nr:hypothetical protein [Candidatus Heimdallarchaeota archaeon]MCK5048203.1 hypothetical protein [Candidatus Heimdallarchaeota archaeon]
MTLRPKHRILFTSILISTLLATLLFSPNIVSVKAATNNYLIELPDGTNVTAQVTSSLSWNTQSNNVTVNFHLADFGENSSYVIFEFIKYSIILTEENLTEYYSLTSYPYINASETDFSHEVELLTPDGADDFLIEITVRMTNSSRLIDLGSEFFQTYTILFPENGVITVDRDQVFPLIDLYGFPERSAFLSWFLVYFLVLTFMSSPALVLGGKRLYLLNKRRKMK